MTDCLVQVHCALLHPVLQLQLMRVRTSVVRELVADHQDQGLVEALTGAAAIRGQRAGSTSGGDGSLQFATAQPENVLA